MKRKDIISTLDQTGEFFDHVDGAVATDKTTGDNAASVTKDEIRAMQTAIYVSVELLKYDGERKVDANDLAMYLLNKYAIAKVQIAEESKEHAEPDTDTADSTEGESGAAE